MLVKVDYKKIIYINSKVIGCGWCDSSQQCLPIKKDESGPCGEQCANNDQCWKNVLYPVLM